MTKIPAVPDLRVRTLCTSDPRAEGRYVLYWMSSARRLRDNFALQLAIELATERGLPLLLAESLGAEAPHHSQRSHRWLLQGMADHAAHPMPPGVHYYPYVESSPGEGRGWLRAVASEAAVVVVDDNPVAHLRPLVRRAAERLGVRTLGVEGCTVMPLSLMEQACTTAHSFRRRLHPLLPELLQQLPAEDPLGDAQLPSWEGLSPSILQRWPSAKLALQEARWEELTPPSLDSRVTPVGERGGSLQAYRQWTQFLQGPLRGYAEDRNSVTGQGTSGLSPALHFGHISPHTMVRELLTQRGWTPEQTQPTLRGKRAGWWGLDEGAEAFLDQLLTWRELGHLCWHHIPDAERYETLPGWALKTLEEHAGDPRPVVYSLHELEQAMTEDPLWNAAQTQLVVSGRMHNYLRMLWGKKILQWSAHPRQALDHMLILNNRYALDGRDANSLSGIMWTLGRFDRAWGPERPIFGKVRYMTSQSTMRKLKPQEYMKTWEPQRHGLG